MGANIKIRVNPPLSAEEQEAIRDSIPDWALGPDVNFDDNGHNIDLHNTWEGKRQIPGLAAWVARRLEKQGKRVRVGRVMA